MWLGPPLVVLNNFGGALRCAALGGAGSVCACVSQASIAVTSLASVAVSSRLQRAPPLPPMNAWLPLQARSGSSWLPPPSSTCSPPSTCRPRACRPARCALLRLPRLPIPRALVPTCRRPACPTRPAGPPPDTPACAPAALQRVLLLDYSKETGRISLRHYSIGVAPSGVRWARLACAAEPAPVARSSLPSRTHHTPCAHTYRCPPRPTHPPGAAART